MTIWDETILSLCFLFWNVPPSHSVFGIPLFIARAPTDYSGFPGIAELQAGQRGGSYLRGSQSEPECLHLADDGKQILSFPEVSGPYLHADHRSSWRLWLCSYFWTTFVLHAISPRPFWRIGNLLYSFVYRLLGNRKLEWCIFKPQVRIWVWDKSISFCLHERLRNWHKKQITCSTSHKSRTAYLQSFVLSTIP